MNKASGEETSELQLENVAGVFFILVSGILLAGVVCLIEYCTGQVIHLGKVSSVQLRDFKMTFKNSLFLSIDFSYPEKDLYRYYQV